MRHYDVAAYIWPAYTGDEPRTRMFWPEGMGEWQTVRAARAKFPGHDWPRRPLWGYVNEADPCVMEMEINAALSHGVNVFIYDWYWYDRRPFLENCLRDGFLKAKNSDKMRFYLMWANHDANTLWDRRISSSVDTVIWQGGQSAHEIKRITERVIEEYFKRPNYYTIDDCPVFMIYEVSKLAEGLGGIDNARRALDGMRDECIKRGLPGLHLQYTLRGANGDLTGCDGEEPLPVDRLDRMGFDSRTHYQYVHFADIDRPYGEVFRDVRAEWDRLEAQKGACPYYPHVSLGWDNNPRFETFRPGIMTDCTPENIKEALRAAKAFLDARPERTPLVTINSWNEWTESSYLEPDDRYGLGYLEAVRDVFGAAE